MGIVFGAYFSTRNLEGGDVSLPDLDVLHSRPNLVNDAAELVPEDVALLQLDDCTVQQVEVTSADRRSGNLQNHILVLEDFGFRDLN
jgi:uncharacterized protein YjbI with pentapeptide repeats